MNPKLILSLVLVSSGLLSGCFDVCAQAAAANQIPATNSLQMSLSVLKTDNRDDPGFEVTIRNTGKQDVSLNLGMMLANGKVMIPDKIHLNLADGSGRSRELLFQSVRVSGRVDDYVVPLRGGSAYMVRFQLDELWSPSTQEYSLKLEPGRYEISAQFQGDGAEHVNSDMQGMKLMDFWKGKLQSNVVAIAQ